jgi:hypothetical protein
VPAWLDFHKVDTLIVEQQFFTDTDGIYKAIPSYWEKQKMYINSHSFRGNEFFKDTSDAITTILLIGDSFTWGAYAQPIDSSFADLLNSQDTIVFNSGIPGADPAQYAAVAEKLISKLHPDITIVMLYLGNDIMERPRKILPNKNLYYQTNVGWLSAFHEDRYFSSAEESWEFARKKYSPANNTVGLFLKTATGTAIISFPLRWEEYRSFQKAKKSGVTNEYLRQIKTLCENYNSRYFVFVIPSLHSDLKRNFFKDPVEYVQKKYPKLLNGIENETTIFRFQPQHYWPLPDEHLNNAGHKQASRFIRKKISSEMP